MLNKRVVVSVFFIGFILVSSCTNRTVEPITFCTADSLGPIALQIRLTDTINLKLDSVLIVGGQTAIDYAEKDNTLRILDDYNNRLLEYRLDTVSAIIHPVNAYPINFNKKATYFKWNGPDQLLLYAYGPFSLHYYSLSTGRVSNEVSLVVRNRDPSFDYNPSPPYASQASPIVVKENSIIGVGFLLGEHDKELLTGRTICTEVNLNNKSILHKIPYSKPYQEGNWGGAHMRQPYATFNYSTDELLVSLPADHNVQVIDSAWNVRNVYAGSRRKYCISSLAVAKNSDEMRDADFGLNYYLNTPSYRNIIYDKYKNCYYRILEVPLPTEPDNNKQTLGKQIKLIVFDDNLNYRGETDLPNGMALDNFFVTSNGLHILNTNNKDEDLGQYLQFTISF